MKTAELIAEVTALPVEDRALVADCILKSLNAPNPEIDQQWASLAMKRLEEIQSGQVRTFPAEEIFERIRNHLVG